MRIAAALLLFLAACLPAQAGVVVSERADKVALVVYSLGGGLSPQSLSRMPLRQQRDQGLALVSETRSIDLPAGISDIRFRNVSATLVAPSVQVTGLEGVSQHNFDFNLLTPGALLAKSIGQTIHLRRVNPRTGAITEVPALVRSGPEGVVLVTDHGPEALDCSGLNENLIFDRLPDTLFETPTLSVHADVPKAGRYVITLRYLATGLNWSANYVARMAPGGASLDLTGWLTLANAAETGFADVPVDLVAGAVNRTGQDRAIIPSLLERSSQCWPMDIDWSSVIEDYETVTVSAGRLDLQGFSQPTPVAVMAFRAAPPPALPVPPVVRDLGDLKLYALGEPTTVAAQQTKQISFLQSRGVPFTRAYRVESNLYDRRSADTEMPSQLVLRLDNAKGGKLGKPLPAGQVTMTEIIGGGPVLAGQPQIDDTPIGVPLELKGSMTQVVSARLRDVTVAINIPGGIASRDHEVTITNRKAVAATFEWSVPSYPGIRVTAESQKHGARAGRLVWSVALKPHSQTKLHYQVQWQS